ncbi:MAG: hypothetical protein IE927_02895 [Rhodobacterales bacterium]|nr:hypothetical protein [Rhodobacterales bacterium]
MMAWVILGLTLAFAVAPALSEPFGGFDPAAFPLFIDRHPVQPAGWAFAIWGLIYAGLLAQAVWGVVARRDDPAWAAMRPPLAVALAIGSGWIALALFDPLTATAAILVMAAAAVTALLRAPADVERWRLSAPVALFAGWLTAASGVSLAVVAGGYGLLAPPVAALLAMAGVLAVALAVQRRRPGMPIYSAPIVWALIAIAAVNGAAGGLVTATALAGAAGLAATALWWARG